MSMNDTVPSVHIVNHVERLLPDGWLGLAHPPHAATAILAESKFDPDAVRAGATDVFWVLSSHALAAALSDLVKLTLRDRPWSDAIVRMRGTIVLAEWRIGNETVWLLASDVLGAAIERWLKAALADIQDGVDAFQAGMRGFDGAVLSQRPASHEEGFFIACCPVALKEALAHIAGV